MSDLFWLALSCIPPLCLVLYVLIDFALVFLSPSSIKTLPSEQTYISALSPTTPKPLPSLSDAGTVDLSIIIPAFNEVTRLPAMLETTITFLTTKIPNSSMPKITFEIVIVDDGSTDDTIGTALNLSKKYAVSGKKSKDSGEIRIVKLEKNLGKGGAVRHGMLHARGRRLLMVDADGASRFEDLELLWVEMQKVAPLKGDASAVVIGSRAHLVKTEAVVKRSFLRNVAMYGLHTVLRLVGVGHIRDTQCGLKLFTRSAAQRIFPHQHLTGWIFDVELLLYAKQLEIPVVEVPIAWEEVPASKLKLVRDSIRMFTDLLVLRLNQLYGRWGVRGEAKDTAETRKSKSTKGKLKKD